MQFYAPQSIGKTRRLTPEGFLVCEGVPIARTGEQRYAPGETPVNDGGIGYVRIVRDADEVFRAETILSFSGKPVVNDHPSENVTPENWKRYAVGTVLHPRRGEGADDHLLVADILVTDSETIRAIQAGKVEVSCGYDAAYEQIEPGYGRQRNIIGNHVALVEKGRCGPSCAIGDHAMSAKKSMFARFLDAAKVAKTDDELDALLAADGGNEPAQPAIHVHMPAAAVADAAETAPAWAKALAEQVTGLKATVDKLTADAESKKDDEDEDAMTEDEAMDCAANPTADSVKALHKFVAAKAEIIAPGFSIPTFDAASDPVKTFDRLCKCKRRALDAAYKTDKGKAAIDHFLTGSVRDFDKLSQPVIDAAFLGASAVMASANNSGLAALMAGGVARRTEDGPPPTSLEAVAAQQAKYWAERQPKFA